MIWIAAIIVVLIFCSAFASGSETALFSRREPELENTPADDRVRALLDDREYTLATILVTNNLVNISIVILSSLLIARTMHFSSTIWQFVFTSVIVTFVLLLFGEILPKTFATYNATRLSRTCAPVIAVLKKILRPAAWLLVATGSRIKGKSRENLSLDQLSDALDVTEAHSDEEKQILEGIVSFAGREVGEIMRPRLDMTALDVEDDFAHVKEVIISSGFSRIPVFEGSIDHIKGILYIKDVVPYISEPADFDWQRLIRRALFTPEHKKIDDLLVEFQAGRRHVAIVVDEYGATRGLVSLEDILEEIVGEISDESDSVSALFTRTGENEWVFDGKSHLVDVERVLELSEDFFSEHRGEAETLAGLMLEIKRGFLRKGESVSLPGLSLTVMSLDGRRIEKIKVIKG